MPVSAAAKNQLETYTRKVADTSQFFYEIFYGQLHHNLT